MEQELLILLLQQLYGQPVVYLKDLQVYGFAGEPSDGMLPVYPITRSPNGQNVDVHWVTPSDPNLVTAEKIFLQLPRPENFGKSQAFFSAKSEESQEKVRTESSFGSETVSTNSDIFQEKGRNGLTKNQRKIADYYRLDDFSILYDGHVAELARSVFLLTINTLNATSKSKTIDKILGLYEEARKRAKKGTPRDIQRLREIAQALQTLQKQQQLATENREKYARKQKRKTLVYFVIGLIVLAGAVYYSLRTSKINMAKHEQAAPSASVQIEEPQYYIVIGSYSNKKLAEKYASKNGGEILENGDTYRVYTLHYSTIDSAKTALKFYRKTYPNSWILKY